MTKAQEAMTNQPLMIALPILGSAAAATTVTLATVAPDFSGLFSATSQADAAYAPPIFAGPVKSLPSSPDGNAAVPNLAGGPIVVTGKPVIPSVFVVKMDAESAGTFPAEAAPAETAVPDASVLPAPNFAVPGEADKSFPPDTDAKDQEGDDDPADALPLPNAVSAVETPLIMPALVAHARPAAQSSDTAQEKDTASVPAPKVGGDSSRALTGSDQIVEAATQRILPHTPAVMPHEKQAIAVDAQVDADPAPVLQASAPVLPERAAEAPRAAQAPLSVHSSSFGEELGIAIARHVTRGDAAAHETMTVRLDPPEHGRIEVSLSFEDGGPLRAVVAASHTATLDLLRRDSADLARALSQAGVNTDAQSFSFSAQTQDGRSGRRDEGFSPQTAFATADEESAVPAAQDYRRLRTRGSLNLIA